VQTELILIRHGETTWNFEMRFQGQQNSPLTAVGTAQAEAVAAYLRADKPTALYSSDLLRTLQTAQPIALATGLTIIQEPALRERNLGIFEGLTRQEAELHHAPHYARYLARELDYVIPSGESLAQLNQRSTEIMQKLALRHPGERVAIVSHGALLTSFLRQIITLPHQLPSHSPVPNGSISRILYDIDSGSWKPIRLGEIPQQKPTP
jgi:probable phosphoglycerate mutase